MESILVLFWLLIMICMVLAMSSEVFDKPIMKRAARWIFVGSIILLIIATIKGG